MRLIKERKTLLSELLPNGSKSAFDDFNEVLSDLLSLQRSLSGTGKLDSLPRTPIAAIEDRHGSVKLGLRAYRNDDRPWALRIADAHHQRASHQLSEFVDRFFATLPRQPADVGFDGALLDRSGRAARRIAAHALREWTARAALLASDMADPRHGWLLHLLN